MAILLMLLSIIVHQCEGIFIKKYNSKHEKGGFVFTAIISVFSMVFFILTDKDGLVFNKDVVLYGIIAGIFFCLASFTTYVALGCGSYVMTRLIMSYGILITIAQGFILGEAVTFMKCTGIAIILFSLYFVKNDDEKSSIKITKKWLVNISLTVIGAGVYGIIQRHQQIIFADALTNEFMIVSLSVSAVILLVTGLIRDGRELGYVLKNGGLYAIGGGLSNGLTNMLTLIVYTMVPLSYSAPVKTGISIIYSFIVSKLIFKEQFTKKQIFGVTLGMIALILLNI